MSANATTIEIPASLYARLQSLASKQKTDPAHVVEWLINASSETADAVEYNGIVRDPALRGGRPIIAGTGVTVRTVVAHYKLGLTPEEIADEMSLELASVYAALAFYHRHRDEIEADILANSEERVMREFGARPHA